MLAGIYLVSACGSADEFVAAFRRYADRTGLFVPAASPLPQGRKGRIALTLKDGGVMLEGEAEVVQSSAKSPLHGRAGMVLKFIELDEPSKTVLAELEKARLAMKPPPPSVPPRPADAAFPSEPRPIVPAIGGRIDAANALAECVVIGDLGALEEVAGGPPKAGPKFVVPSIPAFGARPKSATTPPEGTKPEPAKADAPKPDATRMTTMGMPALRPPGEASGPMKTNATAIPAAAAPKKDPTPVPAAAAPVRSTAAMDAEWDEPPASKSGPVAAPASKSGPVAAPPPAPAAAPPAAKASAKSSKMTQLGFPVVKPPADSEPKATTLGVVPLRATDAPPAGVAAPAIVPAPPKLPDASASGGMKPPLPQPTPTRSKSPTAPPRQPTPFAPLPVAKLPAKPAPALVDADIDEKTDLTTAPVVADSAFIESKPPPADVEPERKPQRSGGMRASEIMAAVHADDWTMTPDASGPTVLAAEKAAMPEVPEPTPSPGAPPTGDWTMSLDPAAGWSRPEKVGAPSTAEKPTKIEKRNPVVQTPATGNPVKAVSSDRPIDIQAWEDKPTSIGAKIEIDATLMEPLDPMPAIDEEPMGGMAAASSGGMGTFPLAGSAPGMPMMAPGFQPPPAFPPPSAPDAPPPFAPNATGPETAVTESLLHAPLPLPLPPPPGAPIPQEIPIGYAPTLLPGQMAAPPLQYATAQPGDLYRGDPSPIAPPRSNKKLIVIVASALTVLLAVVLALTLGGKKKHPADSPHTEKGSAIVVIAGSAQGSQQPAVVVPDTHGSDAGSAGSAGSATQQVVTPPPPKADKCPVEVVTTPAGAEVSLEDKTVLGTTPGTFELPCDTATKLKIQKAKYLGVVRQVTPTAAGAKIAVTLGQGTFMVKITSTPAGASISVGGRSKGVTPAAVQLPAFQTVTITLSKEGYSSESEKVVIKANGQSHHVALKRAGRSSKRAETSHGLNGI